MGVDEGIQEIFENSSLEMTRAQHSVAGGLQLSLLGVDSDTCIT